MTNAYGQQVLYCCPSLGILFAIILYFGAVFTRVYAIHMGSDYLSNKILQYGAAGGVESKQSIQVNSRKLNGFLKSGKLII